MLNSDASDSFCHFLANPLESIPPPFLPSVVTPMETNPLLRSNRGARSAGGAMSYTIGFIPRKQQDVSATEAPAASRALAMIAALQESAEEIRFIRSPPEGDMGIEMLLLLAKEEAEEIVPQPGIWKPR